MKKTAWLLLIVAVLSMTCPVLAKEGNFKSDLKIQLANHKDGMERLLSQYHDEWISRNETLRRQAETEYLEIGRVFVSAPYLEIIFERYAQKLLIARSDANHAFKVESYMRHSIHCCGEMLDLMEGRWGKVSIDPACLQSDRY